MTISSNCYSDSCELSTLVYILAMRIMLLWSVLIMHLTSNVKLNTIDKYWTNDLEKKRPCWDDGCEWFNWMNECLLSLLIGFDCKWIQSYIVHRPFFSSSCIIKQSSFSSLLSFPSYTPPQPIECSVCTLQHKALLLPHLNKAGNIGLDSNSDFLIQYSTLHYRAKYRIST